MNLAEGVRGPGVSLKKSLQWQRVKRLKGETSLNVEKPLDGESCHQTGWPKL